MCLTYSVDLQSVTSIWTQSQQDQQSVRAGTTASSSTQQPLTAPSSTDSLQSRKKRKNIRQLLSNRVAPLSPGMTDAEDGSGSAAVGRNQLDLPVYSKFITSSNCMQTFHSLAKDASVNGSAAVIVESNDRVRGHDQMKNDSSEVDQSDASTVAAESDYGDKGLSTNSAAADVVSDEAEDAESETDVHSNSNYSIASSDTAALSIKLDENYDPVVEPVADAVTEPKPLITTAKVSMAKAVVRPLEARRPTIPQLRASASLPTKCAVTTKTNSATQTSLVHPPVGYYQQPFPYPMFGFSGYLPPMCETPIWPPYAYPPPFPWYYGAPHYDPMQYMPAAPPYCIVPPSATTASNSNQSNLQQPSETVRGIPESHSAVTTELSKPTMVPPSSFQELSASATDKQFFRPLATRSCFQPTSDSLFKPVENSEKKGTRQVSRSEPVADEKLSRSLLEMVELITPQLDSGTDHASDNSDDAEDEAEREAWEAEERERQRIRRRHTRQWMRALRTDVDHTQLSDTSL